jgi:regulator of sigma E protease
MTTVLFIIFCLVILIVFHELGHFLMAKKFGVEVEEFGVGIPPRVFGKKIGETIYSLNWIPLGGFVKLHGEDEKIDDEKSFSTKPIYQRALIVSAGVVAFFIIAFFIFSLYFAIGVRVVVDENTNINEISNPEIIITSTLKNSPAEEAGIKKGDKLLAIDGTATETFEDVEMLLKEKETEEVNIKINRNGEEIILSAFPRESENEEGALGIAMLMTAEKEYPLYRAPIEGAVMTWKMTSSVLKGFYLLFKSLFTSGAIPKGMEIGGPVAIVNFGADAFSRGLSDFLYFLGAITVSLAVLNILPIPALDGGRLVFLAIEKIKGGPIPEKLEYGLNAIFFVLLLCLMVLITFKDLGL